MHIIMIADLTQLNCKRKNIISDNPVLCDERVFELVTVLENLNARVSGVSTCPSPQTSAPVLMRALNDIVPQDEDAPVFLVAHAGGVRVLPRDAESRFAGSQLTYRRVGTIIGQVLPEREGGLPVVVEPPVTLPPTTNVVVKWPDERREEPAHPHPLADLRMRDLAAPQ